MTAAAPAGRRTRATMAQMPRPNRSVACLCIAVVALTALLPGLSAFTDAVFEPRWVLLLDQTPATPALVAATGDEQTLSLLPLAPSRGPPSLIGA